MKNEDLFYRLFIIRLITQYYSFLHEKRGKYRVIVHKIIDLTLKIWFFNFCFRLILIVVHKFSFPSQAKERQE